MIVNYTYELGTIGNPLTGACDQSADVVDGNFSIVVNNPLDEHIAFIGVKVEKLATSWQPDCVVIEDGSNTHLFFLYELATGDNTIEIHFGD
ncbi:MAG: hypothetical protein H6824_01265 [Planctomycetaceae bacterium]|nr:hypothetical protein [Planctomycetaceae bacterium]